MRVSFRRIAGFLLIGLLIELAFFAGMMFGPQLVGVLAGRSSGGHAPLLDEAWDIAEGQFYGPLPTDQARTYGAVRGMMESFKDPYSVFVEPPQTELQSQQASAANSAVSAPACGVRRMGATLYRRFPIDLPRKPACKKATCWSKWTTLRSRLKCVWTTSPRCCVAKWARR